MEKQGQSASKKKKLEDKLRKRREAQRKRREKIKNNPMKYELIKKRENERFALRVANGKIKSKANMSKEELKDYRDKNLQAVRRYQKKKLKNIQSCKMGNDESENPQRNLKSERGRKIRRKSNYPMCTLKSFLQKR